MLLSILNSRLIDVLLIGLAIYFIFPSLFKKTAPAKKTSYQSQGSRSYNTNTTSNTTIHRENPKQKEGNKVGEYIDYEEVK